MAMDTTLKGSITGNGAEVDSTHRLKVNLATSDVPAEVGAIRSFSEVDPGLKMGSPTLRSAEVSQDYRVRTGLDTVLFTDSFNASGQNISLYKHAFATMTMTMSSGFLNVNAAGTSTASANYAYLQTQRYFQIIGTAPLAVELTMQFDRVPVANEFFQAGLGVPTGASDPLDGCQFEYSSSGINGCYRYNSGSVQKDTLISGTTGVPVNTNMKCVMVVGARSIEQQIDDVLYRTTAMPNAQAQPFLTTALPVFIQKYNSALVGSSPNMIAKVGNVTVTLMDINANMTQANQMASCGLAMQQLNGGSATTPMVQQANTTLPTAAAATNTTAALGAYFGGIFQMNAPATSTTDVIIASYQNPVGSVNQTPRTIKLRGIKIDCVNSVVAVATTPTTFAVALAQGGTSVTLAATESTSFQTATTKLRRIQPLGVIYFPVAAVVGQPSDSIQFDFEAPLVINPGEYIQVIAKILVGTATATEVFQQIISPNLYHE